MDEHAPIVYDVSQYKEETKSWDTDPSAYLLRYYTKYYFLASGGKRACLLGKKREKIIDHETRLEVIYGDQFVYQAPNKLCITGLAPTHPLIARPDRYKILNIRFDTKIQNALPQPTAIPANSKKQPPPSCHAETIICRIEALDLEEQNRIELTKQKKEPNTYDEGWSRPSEQASTVATVPDPKVSIDSTRVLFVVRGAVNGHVMELNERLVRRGTDVITDPVVLQTLIEKASTHGFIAVIRPKVDKTEIALEDLYTMEEYNIRREEMTAKEKNEDGCALEWIK
ncbi:hypothetical protein BGX28_003033 [Mortierella sp. GBA30]|nr:hypothetical protein BGX28_003033 [Mortierella sp. GBA30]